MRRLVALAGMMCAASPGLAREEVNSPWFIQEIPVPTDVQTVRPGDFITRSPLLPLGIATLDQDAVSAVDDQALAPAGTQLYRLNEGWNYVPADKFPGVIYCTVAEVRQFKQFLGPTSGARLCLFDAQEDRQFDGWFWKACGTGPVPAVRGSVPKKKSPLQRLTYTVLDVKSMADPPFLGLRYVSRNLGGGFRFELTGLEKAENVDDDLPDTGEVAGIRFTVLSFTNGALNVRIDQTMPAGVFGFRTATVC